MKCNFLEWHGHYNRKSHSNCIRQGPIMQWEEIHRWKGDQRLIYEVVNVVDALLCV